MRKFFGVVIGFVLCLLLTACGGTNNEEMISDIIVHVQVNPSFDIHVNNDGRIKSVECLNEDAQKVYAEMDLTGAVYEEGLEQLLVAIYDAGYVNEDAKIMVEIKQKSSVTYEVSKVTDTILADFSESVPQVEIDVKSEVVIEESNDPLFGLGSHAKAKKECVWWIDLTLGESKPVDFQIYLDENQDIIYAYSSSKNAKKIDEKVNLVGKNVAEGFSSIIGSAVALGAISDDDCIGFSISKEPEINGMYALLSEVAANYMLENGKYFRLSYSTNDAAFDQYLQRTGEFAKAEKDGQGRIWKYTETYLNGICVSRKGCADDGSIDECTYSADGMQVLHSVYMQADGSGTESKHTENGECIYQKQIFVDGSVSEVFKENDKIVKIINRGSSGEEIQTFENDVQRTQFFKGVDGSSYEIYFDENGVRIEEHYIETDGRKIDVTYYANGKTKMQRVVYPDGTMYESYFDENGNYIGENNN